MYRIALVTLRRVVLCLVCVRVCVCRCLFCLSARVFLCLKCRPATFERVKHDTATATATPPEKSTADDDDGDILSVRCVAHFCSLGGHNTTMQQCNNMHMLCCVVCATIKHTQKESPSPQTPKTAASGKVHRNPLWLAIKCVRNLRRAAGVRFE